jgi:lipopolysaccharide exporter
VSDVRRSLVWSLIDRYLQIVLQLVSFFLLARLLTPNDIGLFSVAAAIIGVAHMVRDFGLSTYLIQEADLTQERVRTAFTITLLISLALFAVIQLIAGPMADFYSDDRMRRVVAILAFNFLFIPFNSTTLSCLRREMRFDILAMMNVPASLAGAVVAVVLAVLDFGYMSLVWSAIANTVTLCLAGGIYRRREFFLRPTLTEWRRVFHFGSRVTFVNVLSDLSSRLVELAFGRVLGFTAVGFLSRAQGIVLVFQRDIMEAINNVAFPGFARATREGGDMERIYCRTVTAVTAMAWPFYGFFALFPLESLRVMFGPQWDASAPLVPVYCLAGALAATSSLINPMLNAAGRIDLITRAEVILQPMRLLILVGTAIVFASLLPVALAAVVTTLLAIPIQYWVKGRALATRWAELRAAILASAKLTFVSLLLPGAVKLLVVAGYWVSSGLVILSAAAFALTVSWVLGLRWLDHPLVTDPIFPYRLRRLIRCENVVP